MSSTRQTFVLMLTLAGVAFALDVGVDTILAPSGTIDSGQSIYPRCVVANYGDTVEDVRVHMTVDAGGGMVYSDSLLLSGLAPAQLETVAFRAWTPQGRDSMTATAWTECAGDTCPQNDTFRQRFLVRVRDLAVVQIIMPPPDTVFDSGVVFYPSCRVSGYGNGWPDTCIVGFRIGEYSSACTLCSPPWPDTITAPDSYVTMPGIWPCRATAMARGDLHPGNNTMVDTFTVTGNTLFDVEARAVLAPSGVIHTMTLIHPTGRVRNNSAGAASFKSFFIIQNSSGSPVYADSANHMLGAGDSADVVYQDACINVIGAYTAAESVFMDGDQNSINDVKRVGFFVGRGDIGITAIFEMPCDTVDTLTTFRPSFRLKNVGIMPETGYVTLAFSDTVHDRVVYRDSEFFQLPAGGEITMAFDSVRFTTLGPHEGQSWFWAFSGYADTLAEWQFWVVPFVPGVEEGLKPQASSLKHPPTVVRSLPPGAVVFDAMGRRAVKPKSGIYFVREQSAISSQHSGAENGARSTVHVRKVILQR